jgi:hypothetical protein
MSQAHHSQAEGLAALIAVFGLMVLIITVLRG